METAFSLIDLVPDRAALKVKMLAHPDDGVTNDPRATKVMS